MNITSTASPSDTIGTAIASTVASIVTALGIMLVAYMQRVTRHEIRHHGERTREHIDGVQFQVRQMASSQQSPSPSGSDNGATCPHCVALARD